MSTGGVWRRLSQIGRRAHERILAASRDTGLSTSDVCCQRSPDRLNCRVVGCQRSEQGGVVIGKDGVHAVDEARDAGLPGTDAREDSVGERAYRRNCLFVGSDQVEGGLGDVYHL